MATGTRNVGQHVLESNNSDRVNKDFENFIDYDDKTKWPMAAWLAKKENSVQKDTEEFALFSGELIPRTLTITVTITTTDAAVPSLAVSSTDGVVAGTLLHVKGAADGATAGELLRVTAVTTTLAVSRVTTVAQIADNAVVAIIGNISTEVQTDSPAAFDMEPATVTGYMSILKRRIDITKTERNSKVRGARDRLAEKIDRARMDFMLDIEHLAWFSRAVEDSTNRLRYSMGIHSQIAGDATSVEVDCANALATAAKISSALTQAAKYAATSNFACFHGRYGMDALFTLGQADLQSRYSDTGYGFKAQRMNVSSFVLDWVYTRVFDIIGSPYQAMIFGLDLGAIKNVHLKEGRARLERNVQSDPSGEVESHQFRYQGGISVTWPRRHFTLFDQD
jgi:alkylhydroperoxidase/carboxymuconolactone decarboxylase family protein YurZ